MLEKEAKEKTCPFIQHAGVVGTNQIKAETLDLNIPANVHCITTKCMAWTEGSWLNDQVDGYCMLIQKG